jgi:hypothetical protein
VVPEEAVMGSAAIPGEVLKEEDGVAGLEEVAEEIKGQVEGQTRRQAEATAFANNRRLGRRKGLGVGLRALGRHMAVLDCVLAAGDPAWGGLDGNHG